MIEFISLTIISVLTVILIISIVLGYHGRLSENKTRDLIFIVSVEIICMLIGKFGANANLNWRVYYTVPMLLTMFGPPVYFKLNKIQIRKYLALTFISAPLIHVLFSFFFGWKNYMPFIKVPSFWEI